MKKAREFWLIYEPGFTPWISSKPLYSADCEEIHVREVLDNDPKDEVIKIMKEALEMGAFHHNACPWLNGKECCCARQKVDLALAAVDKLERD